MDETGLVGEGSSEEEVFLPEDWASCRLRVFINSLSSWGEGEEVVEGPGGGVVLLALGCGVCSCRKPLFLFLLVSIAFKGKGGRW